MHSLLQTKIFVFLVVYFEDNMFWRQFHNSDQFWSSHSWTKHPSYRVFFLQWPSHWFQQIRHCRKYLAATVILASIAWSSQYWARHPLNRFDSISINYRIVNSRFLIIHVEWWSPNTLHFHPVIESLKSTSSHLSN